MTSFKNAGRVKDWQDLLAIRQWRGDGVWMESDHDSVARKVAVSESGSSWLTVMLPNVVANEI